MSVGTVKNKKITVPTPSSNMNCKKPLRRWFLGYKVSKQDPTKDVEHGKVTPLWQLSPYAGDDKDLTKEIPNQIIACGQCAACRLEQSRQWAVRCLLESRKYEDNWFVTLTYDPEHVPLAIGEDDGWRMSLKADHLTDFMKRLRRHLDYHEDHEGIRFYGAGNMVRTICDLIIILHYLTYLLKTYDLSGLAKLVTKLGKVKQSSSAGDTEEQL